MTHSRIAVLGAGSWGTALALHLARQKQDVFLWSGIAEEIKALQSARVNERYLPGFPFPKTIHPVAELADAIEATQDILMVVPSIVYRETLQQLKSLMKPGMRIINASKGLDECNGQLLNEMVADVLGHCSFAVLSGPSFATEVARGLPTAVVIATQDAILLDDARKRFESPSFRIYPSLDVVGVEVGGVVKNVIAIAVGIVDGLQMGANARSALLTYALEEITNLGVSLGGNAKTFVGLSGMGDLILTCLDDQSRNRRFGLALGKGESIKDAEQKIGQVVEGKRNVDLVLKLAKQNSVHMPISTMVSEVVNGKPAKEAVIKLFSTI